MSEDEGKVANAAILEWQLKNGIDENNWAWFVKKRNELSASKIVVFSKRNPILVLINNGAIYSYLVTRYGNKLIET